MTVVIELETSDVPVAPNPLVTLIRDIERFRAGDASAFVTADRLARVWLLTCARCGPDPAVTYALNLCIQHRARPGPKKKADTRDILARLEVLRDNPDDRSAYVSKREISEHLRSRASPSEAEMQTLLLYIADMLDGVICRQGRSQLNDFDGFADFVARNHYYQLLERLEKVRTRRPRVYAKFVKAVAPQEEKLSPSHMSLEIIRRHGYPHISTVASLRWRLWRDRYQKPKRRQDA